METAIPQLLLRTGQDAVILVQVAHLDIKVIDCIDLNSRVALLIVSILLSHHHFLFLHDDLLLILELAVNLSGYVIDARIDHIQV